MEPSDADEVDEEGKRKKIREKGKGLRTRKREKKEEVGMLKKLTKWRRRGSDQRSNRRCWRMTSTIYRNK